MDKMMTQDSWAWAYDFAFDEAGAYLFESNEGHWPDEGQGTEAQRAEPHPAGRGAHAEPAPTPEEIQCW